MRFEKETHMEGGQVLCYAREKILFTVGRNQARLKKESEA